MIDNAVVVIYGGNSWTAMGVLHNLGLAKSSYKTMDFFGLNCTFLFMDYPCSGMSKHGSTTDLLNNACALYEKAIEKKGDRTLWVITISIGMAVFASILPRIEDKNQPDNIVCINGLMSMRKTIMKIQPALRIFYYGLGKDFNTARLIPEHLKKKECRFFWIQGTDDDMIDIPNLITAIKRWNTEKNIHVNYVIMEGYGHNDISISEALYQVEKLLNENN